MPDPKVIEAEWGDFFQRHPYSTEPLNALPSERFVKKWKMLLRWQDDHKVTTGTQPEVTAQIHTLRESLKVLERVPPSKYPRVLDLGCAGGEPEALRRLGYQVTGFTLGPLNVLWAKERYGLDLVYGDMHDLPFPAASFDAVICKESFEHCFAPILVTIEVNHVLREHGKWFMSVPDASVETGFNWSHPTILTATQRKALFEAFGFKVLENTEMLSLCMKLSTRELKDTPIKSIQNMRRTF